ncbi:YqaE/Pmp3 family membrane protein [Merismopedia glauca]|uniref:YqaE/Pmp3 family membrane protein n=1 Tax=Merismopedia glauca CCAP 1448/3 TaxID=1296344 RepID=A0A2T1C024_9CYAN|nr:YqaE/Pmp3 family membrane protein [Merismopedia glauca]PSB01592.1 YqaE/Pmp3 family membrane protein [Merismopedia glauca CCAP 1448/3]
MKLLRLILAIALPPVAVFLTFGISSTLLINILLTLLGWLPGSIHALWVISKYEERLEQID